jgi:hypothetical protein
MTPPEHARKRAHLVLVLKKGVDILKMINTSNTSTRTEKMVIEEYLKRTKELYKATEHIITFKFIHTCLEEVINAPVETQLATIIYTFVLSAKTHDDIISLWRGEEIRQFLISISDLKGLYSVDDIRNIRDIVRLTENVLWSYKDGHKVVSKIKQRDVLDTHFIHEMARELLTDPGSD